MVLSTRGSILDLQPDAVASALGARRTALAASAALQSAVIALFGCLLAAGAAPVLGALLDRFVPEVAVQFSARTIAALSAATTVIAVLATLPPALRTLRLDPALVFDP